MISRVEHGFDLYLIKVGLSRLNLLTLSNLDDCNVDIVALYSLPWLHLFTVIISYEDHVENLTLAQGDSEYEHNRFNRAVQASTWKSLLQIWFVKSSHFLPPYALH